jgi:RNA recognition motif-containing protein
VKRLNGADTVVEFEDDNLAEKVLQLAKANPLEYKGNKLEVQEYSPIVTKEIIIRNLSANYPLSQLVYEFEAVGKIVFAKMPLNENGNLGYAFLEFLTPEEAKQAISQFHDQHLEEGRLVHVSLKE